MSDEEKPEPGSEYFNCLQKGIRRLALRNRSEKEMADYLALKGFAEEAVGKTLSYMKSRSLLDDQKFAKEYMERTRAKNYGRRKIELELRGKGIKHEIISALIAENPDEHSICMAAALKKLPAVKNAKNAAQKLSLFLSSRGFDWNTVKRVLDEIKLNPQDTDEHV